MKQFNVTYFYLATGMEGRADTKDYGIVEANSAKEAVEKVGYRISPNEKNKTYREWGLSATELL